MAEKWFTGSTGTENSNMALFWENFHHKEPGMKSLLDEEKTDFEL